MQKYLNYFNEQFVPYLKENYEFVLFAIVIIAIVGMILGYTKKITVFRDFNDLGLVFIFICSPLFMAYIIGWFDNELYAKILACVFVLVELGIVIAIIFRTYQDNSNVIFGTIALLTKIPLSLLFILNVLSLINPTGDTATKRRKDRAFSLMWLMFLTPIIVGLVKEKKGFFNPKQIVARRGF
ncbi:hypothetical protein ACFL43_00330 [Thermodesulfobacteriota bacterium]